MGRRIIHDKDFIEYVMTPPVMDRTEYEMYEPKTSIMRVISNGGGGELSSGLGDVPIGNVGGNESNSWVMPVVIIVVSAMALMTLYAVLSKR
jgi:hypothetical protein